MKTPRLGAMPHAVAMLMAIGFALHPTARAAGAFDDLKNSLIQSFGDAAKRNLDAALGNPTANASEAPASSPSNGSAAHPTPSSVDGGSSASATASKTSLGQATPSAAATSGTPLDMSDPNCLARKKGSDGGTRSQNRDCMHGVR